MKTNDILYKTSKALGLSEAEILEAYTLEGYEMDPKHLEALLKKRVDKDFVLCSYEELGMFLDGLVTLKRGPSPKKPGDDEAVELTNNLILKKLRIALELKEPETEIIFGLGDVTLSKQELKSLFRKEGHKNFKTCSDELLIAFLDGLDEFYYTGEEV
ncbi:DUF1456 family protein [Sulfurovum sp. NBC37-1]|uniref:DUF1456 family protein n=1 Tax=Sulfurovum sp. (strain NBC37-1) TaxID=387093 RepID=UPI0001587723|nr:DUF1456 family protein [Sulfurovum sp. NBC37-1]BAF71604.1 conserved hypothetical protein [Sulfurovum sp. NBC37-1]